MTYTAEQQRERYYANLEENRRKHREYARNNREKYNAMRRQRRAQNPEEARKRDRARTPRPKNLAAQARERHGRWAVEDQAAMWEAQKGLCYLCGEEMHSGKEKIDVDHDHSCCRQGRSCRTCRRGLAHHNCNVAAGYAGDSPDRLRRIADALEAAQLAFRQRQKARDDPSNCLLF
jgi:hypothetical protein